MTARRWLVGVLVGLALEVEGAPMSNKDVHDLLAAGMSEGIIVQAIDASEGHFDTSAAELIRLKTAGASDTVIQHLISKGLGVAPAGQSASIAPDACPEVPGDNPDAQGIVMSDAERRVFLPRDTGLPAGSGSSLPNALSMGLIPITVKTGFKFRGPNAAGRSSSRLPAFAGLNMPYPMPPNSKFEGGAGISKLGKMGDSRVYVLEEGSAGLFGVAGGETWDKYVVPVQFEVVTQKCKVGAEEVTPVIMRPANPLEPGEYAVLVGSPNGPQFFTFGVD